MYGKTNLGVTTKLAYVIIYLIPFVGSLIFLVSDGRNRDIRMHCLLSLSLCAAMLIGGLVFGFMGKITYVGWLFRIVLALIAIAYVATMLLGLARALNDKILKIPFFYDLVKGN